MILSSRRLRACRFERRRHRTRHTGPIHAIAVCCRRSFLNHRKDIVDQAISRWLEYFGLIRGTCLGYTQMCSAFAGLNGLSAPPTRVWFRELFRTVRRRGRDGVIHAVRPLFCARFRLCSARHRFYAAGCWPNPTPVAENIRNYVAFSHGVRVLTAEEIGDPRVNPFVTLFRRVMAGK